jgi:murein DD-endopeptidase MepM/ murein hydrolase activator NlpD
MWQKSTTEANAPAAPVRRRHRRALSAVAGVLVMAAAVPAGADPVGDARAKVADAQRAANAAAARYESAQVEMAKLSDEIDGLEQQIAAGEQRRVRLRVVAAHRAVEVYKSGGGAAPFLAIDGDPLDAVRRKKFLEGANARDDAAIDALAEVNDELDRRRAAIEVRREEQVAALEVFRAETRRLEADLAVAQRAQAAAEEEARKAAEAARKADEERQAREKATQSAGSQQTTTPSGRGAASGLICPIQGPVSFVDSWHAPRPGGRLHVGVDLMSPRGTPNVAVVSGTITQKTGGTSGNGVYLHGDNGDLYYYFHLDAYAGGARQVSQGDIVGFVGNTGDASGGATHTHFEIHPGGGSAINPYPAVRAVC